MCVCAYTDIHIHIPICRHLKQKFHKAALTIMCDVQLVFFCLLFYVGCNLLYCFQAYIWVVISVWKTLL